MRRLFDKPASALEYSDLQRLVSPEERVAWPEGRHVEYKRQLPASSEVQEQAADIAAFANGQGGLLIYGIEEDGTLPVAIAPLIGADADRERLRIMDRMRSQLDPPLAQIEVFPVRGPAGELVIVVEIPRSLAGPHAVVNVRSPFVVRTAVGAKRPMDTAELRQAFLELDTWLEQALAYRDERIRSIWSGIRYRKSGMGPETPCVVVHVLPLGRLRATVNLDSLKPLRDAGAFEPWPNERGAERYAADGYLITHQDNAHVVVRLALRNGGAEYVVTVGAGTRLSAGDRTPGASPRFINGCLLEQLIVRWIRQSVLFLGAVDVAPPYLASVVFCLDAPHYKLLDAPYATGMIPAELQLARIELPEQIVTNIDAEPAARELRRLLWQAAGRQDSPCKPAGP